MASGYQPIRLIVVDNGSDEGSCERVEQWLAGLDRSVVTLDYEIDRCDDLYMRRLVAGTPGAEDAELVLIRSAVNRGYSAGMNLGLAYREACRPAPYFWLLNNDVLVGAGALQELVRTCQSDPSIGVCGTLQMRVDERGAPTRRPIPGGFGYLPWLGIDWSIRRANPTSTDAAYVQRHMFGVPGAAVFGTQALLRSIGKLNEESFIYYEEQDLA
ncbi:MAG: glycosyltransferase, partial [Acidimicrobiia bacterium]